MVCTWLVRSGVALGSVQSSRCGERDPVVIGVWGRGGRCPWIPFVQISAVASWDLARSIGADDTLPAGAVEATLMGLGRLPEEMLRSETMFGPAVEVAADASPQDRLLGFVGRQP